MLKLIFKIVPFYAIGSIVTALLGSIAGIIGDVLLTKYVIDSVQFQRSFVDVLTFIGVIALLFIIIEIFTALFYNIYAPILQQKLSKKMQNKLFDKAINTDLKYYDNPDYYKLFIISSSNADTRALDVFDTFIRLISSLFTISGIIAIIIAIDPICILFVIISIVLSLIINMKKSKITYEQDMEIKEINRKRDYIHRVFYMLDYAKEIRISRVSNLLLKKYKQETQQLSKSIKKYAGKNFIYSFANGFVINTLIIDILYFTVLILRAAIFKSISYGSISSMINAAWTLNNSINVIKDIIPQLSLHSMYIANFKDFLDLESSIPISEHTIALPKEISNIQIINGYFKYPNTVKKALKNINMCIEKNKKIAIVGQNGAGKSTLLKILLRFYDLDYGIVKIDGKDLKEYDPKEYRLHVGTVFQDFKLFATKISENVLMDIVQKSDSKAIQDALEAATFDNKLKMLKQDIDSYVTNEFSNDGIYLSGGQEQTIALARLFIKDSLFVILDEASSALDPLTEKKVNEKLMELAADKTVIFISHRLSVTKFVDYIYVLNDGEIIEKGTHNELMKQKGVYCDMFNIQAEKYKL